ncbi:MAG: histone deacetylase family protein, partial [Paracoccaceae bacterium]
MTTALIFHEEFDRHLMPPGHPEQVARLQAVHRALAQPAFDALVRVPAPVAGEAEILRCHPRAYLERVKALAPTTGFAMLDADTSMSPGTLGAALRAVGGNLAAVDMVLDGRATNAFVACRPPGHHAEEARAMGFCLFGNISVAAKYALDHHKLARVAVLDFDVHHGNGTQDLLWSEPRALFCSSHQMPLYPGSGAPGETGASGNVVNRPLAAGSGGAQMRAAWDGVIFPAVEAFAP